MPRRPPRILAPGIVYHVLNRGNDRRTHFHKPGDYQAFERILVEAKEQAPMRVLAYCLMPNHWHLVLWPDQGHDLSRFVGWLTLTHTQRWHAHYHDVGSGHLYQGRFKSFPIQEDGYFYTVCRYAERNALRANLVERAQQWRWGSLWRRLCAISPDPLLDAWPVPLPANWADLVNEPQTEAELSALRLSVQRGQPYGDRSWVEEVAARLRLGQTLRPQGRPRKSKRPSPDSATSGLLFE